MTLFARSFPHRATARCFLWSWVIALSGLACTAPTARALDEAQLKEIRSQYDGVLTKMTFVNHSGETVKVWWIDWKGKRKLYKVLRSGESLEQETWTGHAWLVTDVQDDPWEVFYPKKEPSTVEIESPGPQ